MKVIYDTTMDFEEEMNSGLMQEKYGAIKVVAQDAEVIQAVVKTIEENFKTNMGREKLPIKELEFLIWLSDEDEESLEMTLNEHHSLAKNNTLVRKLLKLITEYENVVEEVRITRDCEINPNRVEKLLNDIDEADIFENILEQIPKLCFIDSQTYLSKEEITRKVDKLEGLLFEELVDKKIRVNGKPGVLKRVDGNCRYGFFERGVRKEYVCLSLVQKVGARTIHDLSF